MKYPKEEKVLIAFKVDIKVENSEEVSIFIAKINDDFFLGIDFLKIAV